MRQMMQRLGIIMLLGKRDTWGSLGNAAPHREFGKGWLCGSQKPFVV